MKKLIAGVLTLVLIGTGWAVLAEDISETTVDVKGKISLTEEQQEILSDKIKDDLKEMLESDVITEEQYEKLLVIAEKRTFSPQGKRGKEMFPGRELTEEEKAEIITKWKDELSAKLASGEITQEEYDEALVKIESGEVLRMGKKPFVSSDKPQTGKRASNETITNENDVAPYREKRIIPALRRERSPSGNANISNN